MILLVAGAAGCCAPRELPEPPTENEKAVSLAELRAIVGGGPTVVISLRTLECGDTVFADVWSQGCFHDIREHLTFERACSSGAAKQDQVVASLHGDAVMLDERDILRLEHLLQKYRSGAQGGCTTLDRVRIDLYQRGRRAAHKEYDDRSCFGADEPTVMNWFELLGRSKRWREDSRNAMGA